MISSGSNAEILEVEVLEYDYEVASGSDAADGSGDLGDSDPSSDLDSFDLESLFTGPGALALSEADILGSEYAESVIAHNPVSAAAEGQTSYVNVIRLDCTIDGESCVLLLPPEHIDKIFIDDQNRLWNMSSSTISGRIVDDQFNPYQTEGRLVYLTACLGNNFSSINNYGSPNYVRDYYWSSGRLTYTDDYCEILVDDYHYPFYASDMWSYLILFLMFGGVLLSWLKNWRKY